MANTEQVKCKNCGKPIDPTSEEVLCDSCIAREQVIEVELKLTDEEMQVWIDNRFGVPNIFNTQLLIDFQGFILTKLQPLLEQADKRIQELDDMVFNQALELDKQCELARQQELSRIVAVVLGLNAVEFDSLHYGSKQEIEAILKEGKK